MNVPHIRAARRAVLVSLLMAVPLLAAACGGSGAGSGGNGSASPGGAGSERAVPKL